MPGSLYPAKVKVDVGQREYATGLKGQRLKRGFVLHGVQHTHINFQLV